MKRLSLAFRCLLSLLFKGTVSQALLAELRDRAAANPTETPEPPPLAASRPPEARSQRLPEGTERAVQMLALLQRDGRLVDFFTEDIGEYDDAQVGAAVRDMHESCRATLSRYLTLQPVIPGEEGKPITVEPGFDPGTVKLIGNVTGKLPARGVLRHHGWQAGEIRLPDLARGASGSVIAPAEVEIS